MPSQATGANPAVYLHQVYSALQYNTNVAISPMNMAYQTARSEAEKTAVRAITHFMQEPDAIDPLPYQRAFFATAHAKTSREQELAYLALGFTQNARQNWARAAEVGDNDTKIFAETLLRSNYLEHTP